MLTNSEINIDLKTNSIDKILINIKGKFYPFPELMSGTFVMRQSTDLQNAKVFAELTTGYRCIVAEISCNLTAREAVELLNIHFSYLREKLEAEKNAARLDRDGLNHYERRQEERRDRYSDLAIKKRRQAYAAFDASHNQLAHMPLGQPILVGHHSEGRHRAMIKRSHNLMDRGCELDKTADYYEAKAGSVGLNGISSDDPDAPHKLAEKVEALKKSHQMMLESNKIIRRKNLNDEQKKEMLFCLGYSEKMIKEIITPSYGSQGFAPYQLSLSNKAIKAAEQRIIDIDKVKELNSEEQVYNGFTVQNDVEDNRIVIRFDSKPDEETRTILKRNAFKCSPSRNYAWVRQITPNALNALRFMLPKLQALS